MSIINAVEKWRPYLIGRHFTIKTNHHSLQFLLEQKITTALHQKGLTKLLGLFNIRKALIMWRLMPYLEGSMGQRLCPIPFQLYSHSG